MTREEVLAKAREIIAERLQQRLGATVQLTSDGYGLRPEAARQLEASLAAELKIDPLRITCSFDVNTHTLHMNVRGVLLAEPLIRDEYQ